MHYHECTTCENEFSCTGDVDLNWDGGPSCDAYLGDGKQCPPCAKAERDGERPERDRDEDDGQTYADPATEMAERLERD